MHGFQVKNVRISKVRNIRFYRTENLTLDGRKSLKATHGKQTAQHCLSVEGIAGQLWSYKTEGWSRKFFDNWKESLKWQRLKPYEKFAEMIETLGWHCSIQQT
ncbi:MAG: hypothetical protein HS132_13205 [Planctomycetia bacterium]|nr:hypothetical protein [Planctomycetia bacterium]